jgi:hypothetical protein
MGFNAESEDEYGQTSRKTIQKLLGNPASTRTNAEGAPHQTVIEPPTPKAVHHY